MNDPALRPVEPLPEALPESPGPLPERVTLDSRRPLLLDERGCVLRIASGHADLFAVPIARGKAVGVRRHLCRIESGGLLLGLSPAGCEEANERVGVLAIGGPATEALVLERGRVSDLSLIEDWICRISATLVDATPDWQVQEMPAGRAVALGAGERRRAPVHGVTWVSLEAGQVRMMELEARQRAGDPPLPLAAGTWLQAVEESSLVGLDRAALSRPDPCSDAHFDPWPSVDRFHALAMLSLSRRVAQSMLAEQRRLDEGAKHSAVQTARLFDELAAVMAPHRQAPAGSSEMAGPLLSACQAVGAVLGVAISRPAGPVAAQGGIDDVLEIAHASRLRLRRVLLRGDWWRRDMGPLVAWRADDHRVVALIPSSVRRYLMIDPTTETRRKVDARLAGELAPEAAMLYPSLPSHPLSGLELIGFCLRLARRDAARLLLAGLAIGALTVAMPIIVQVLIDSVIPRARLDDLAFCAAGLVMVAISMAGMQAAQGFAMLRLEGLLDWKLQAAVVDRLLTLPVAFFRSYTVGDLADRAMGIEAIRRVVTGRAIRGVLAGLFSLFSFILMFYYDAPLAMIAAGFALLRCALMVAVSAVRLHHEHRHFELQGEVQGLILQLLAGVAKLRVASATLRALAVWARRYAAQKRHFVASQRAANWLAVIDLAFPTLATIAIFAASGSSLAGRPFIDTGAFLAFFAAFGQSLAALGEMGAAIGDTLTAVPRFARVRPLLAEAAETSDSRKRPGEFTGAFEIGQVTFRYARSGPPVLNNVTMRVGAGEFVALVGPSGSGKSTIFRLLLGFEQPEAGAVFFEGKALDTLDIAAVRRQIGVVLQNGKLTSGSLYENICGGAQLPLEQAWQAARLAGLEADIAAMPMGMHSVVAEGVSTLSGGQRQKLMIARALVNQPRILLLDEATSALDNRAQAIVSASLAKLNVTRIVIAHRLSTVQTADRIFVLAGGELVQTGTFAELNAKPGLFAELAKRQLL